MNLELLGVVLFIFWLVVLKNLIKLVSGKIKLRYYLVIVMF